MLTSGSTHDYRRPMTRSKAATSMRKENSPFVNSANSARRQEVMDATAAVFARHGFHGVSTRTLADQLGIKVASLYFHFKSKDEALQEICDRGIQSALDFVASSLASSERLEDRVRHYFAMMREYMPAEADYINVFIHERRHMSAPALNQLERRMRKFRKDLMTMFEEAKARGELRDDLSPRSATFILIGTIRHLNQLFLEGPYADFEKLMDDAIEAVLRGLVRGKS